MVSQVDVDLALLMTAGACVLNWVENGSYEREIKLYKELAARGARITLLDYSSSGDLKKLPKDIAQDLRQSKIEIFPLYGDVTPKNNFGKLRLSIANAFRIKTRFTHIKSNQSKGSWLGVILKLRTPSSRFLHRSGYSWSDFTFRIYGSRIRFLLTRIVEISVNFWANEIHVAGERDFKGLSEWEKRKTVVVPNWVKIDSSRTTCTEDKFIFVGRLEPQKNILDLLKHWPSSERLTIIGSGTQLADVMQVIDQRGLRVEHLPRLSHGELMDQVAQSKALIMWSHYEGNPKVVIESLFTGTPIVYRAAPGVNEVMDRGQFGRLVVSSDQLGSVLDDIKTFDLDPAYTEATLFDSTFEHTLEKNLEFLGLESQ